MIFCSFCLTKEIAFNQRVSDLTELNFGSTDLKLLNIKQFWGLKGQRGKMGIKGPKKNDKNNDGREPL